MRGGFAAIDGKKSKRLAVGASLTYTGGGTDGCLGAGVLANLFIGASCPRELKN